MIVFSDSHIDNGHGVFSPNKKRFNRFLDHIEREPLVVAGDLFEWWRFSPEETIAHHMDVIARLRDWKSDLIITPGNHDLRPSLLKVMFPKALVISAFTVYGWTIMHGHKIDPILDTKTERTIAAMAARVVQVCKLTVVDKIVEKMTSAKRANESYYRRLIKTSQQLKYVIGHTHVPQILERFVNVGSISNAAATYAYLHSSGRAELLAFDN